MSSTLNDKSTEWLIEALESYGYSVALRGVFYQVCPVAAEIVKERLTKDGDVCHFDIVVFDPEADSDVEQWFLAGRFGDLREMARATCEMISESAKEGPLSDAEFELLP